METELGQNMIGSKEVQKIMHISPATLKRWRSAGKIPYIKLSARMFRYKREDVERIVQKGI